MMKARRSASPTEKIRLRTWRIDSTVAEPPRLVYDEVDTRLSMSPFNGTGPELPSPERRIPSSPHRSTSARSLLQAPDISPRTSVTPPSTTDNLFDSATSNGLSHWPSSTVGRTSVTGKSGKVIEKLASDLDSAHRERDLYKMRNEELERRLELMRMQMEDLTERKNRAEQESAINEAAISRKERKIGELQVDLDEEIARRIKAEGESKTAISERDDACTRRDREVAAAQERAAFADMSYNAVLKERERDKTKFQLQIDKLQANLNLYVNNLNAAQEKLRKLNTISEQKDAEFSKMNKTVGDVLTKYEKYVNDRDKDHNAFAEMVRERIQTMDGKLEVLEETREKMRWVINVKKNVDLSGRETEAEEANGVSVQKATTRSPSKDSRQPLIK